MKKLISLTLVLVGCSNPTKSPESVAQYFVNTINSGSVEKLETVTPDKFWEGLVYECVGREMCPSQSLACAHEIYRDKHSHRNCSTATSQKDWKAFVKILSEEFAPCRYIGVKQRDLTWDSTALATIECGDGIQDTVPLAQAKDGSWYLSGYFERRLHALQQKVALEQMFRIVNSK